MYAYRSVCAHFKPFARAFSSYPGVLRHRLELKPINSRAIHKYASQAHCKNYNLMYVFSPPKIILTTIYVQTLSRIHSCMQSWPRFLATQTERELKRFRNASLLGRTFGERDAVLIQTGGVTEAGKYPTGAQKSRTRSAG